MLSWLNTDRKNDAEVAEALAEIVSRAETRTKCLAQPKPIIETHVGSLQTYVARNPAQLLHQHHGDDSAVPRHGSQGCLPHSADHPPR